MPHTATRHGRQITLTGCGRQGLHIATRNREAGGLVDRGWIRSVGIRDGRTVWQPVDYDGVWLDRVVGDYVDAEKALLDATTELDDTTTLRQRAATP